MAEPSSSSVSIAALFVTLLGATGGGYALIVMGALTGALWPLSTMTTSTKIEGAMFLLRVVSMAVLLTGSAAWYLETQLEIPVAQSLGGVSFLIGVFGNGWRPIFDGLRKSLLRLLPGASAGDRQP